MLANSPVKIELGRRARVLYPGRLHVLFRRQQAGAPKDPGSAIVPEMGQRLKNITIALLRYLGVAVALALIILVLEVVVGVLLVEVEAMFN